MKIDKKIVAYAVKADEDVVMHEGLKRPAALHGTTYKIKPPDGAALYITINDYVLDSERVPFEIFINSKDMEHYQWVIALTMVISAVFRKGGEVAFLAEELKNVFDPKGGYFKKGEGFVPSIVADIGGVIARHLSADEPEVSTAFLEKKKAEYITANEHESLTEQGFPATATQCPKCHQKAVILMDGCATCLNCGDSKCT